MIVANDWKKNCQLASTDEKSFAYNDCCQTLNKEPSISSKWKESLTNAMIVANQLKKKSQLTFTGET